MFHLRYFILNTTQFVISLSSFVLCVNLRDASSIVPRNADESETRDTACSFEKLLPVSVSIVFHTGDFAVIK